MTAPATENLRTNSKTYLVPENSMSVGYLRRAARVLAYNHTRHPAQQILWRWGENCYICGLPIDLDAPRSIGTVGWEAGLQLDHVVSLDNRGVDIVENVKPAHGLCKLRKYGDIEGAIEVELQVYIYDPFVMTAEIMYTESGYVSEWWVSRQDGDSISVAAHMTLPLFGASLDIAKRRADMIAKQVADFVGSVSGGMGSAAFDFPNALAHAEAHLETYLPQLEGLTKIERTARLYSVLSEFRVPKPAKTITELEQIGSIRTTHDRIARARELGLIPYYGHGRSHA